MRKVRNLPLNERMELYNRTLDLAEEGLNAVEVGKQLDISKNTTRKWINGSRKPDTSYNVPDLSPSEELSYLTGVYLGDGSGGDYASKRTNRPGETHYYTIALNATDEDFVKKFSRCLTNVLERDKPVPVYVDSFSNQFRTVVRSKILLNFLKQPLKKKIEKFPSNFLQGLFDSDGGCYFPSKITSGTRPSIYLYGSKKILTYAKTLLKKYFEIHPTISINKKKGESGIDNSTYSKNVYRLEIKKINDLPKFEEIGFSIKRKQDELSKIIEWVEK